MAFIVILFLTYIVFTFLAKILKKEKGYVFRIKNESSLLGLYFSLVASKINVQNFILISSVVALEGLQGLWFLLTAFIGHGVVVYVFYPLWNQLTYDNENDLILDRYRTKWGNILFHFRGLYVGILVNVTLIAMSLLAMVDIINFFIPINKLHLILVLCLFSLINSWRSGIQDKIFSDTFNVIFFFLFLGFMFYSGVTEYGSWAGLQNSIKNLEPQSLRIFPVFGSPAFAIFLIFVGIQWWSSQTFDGSGKTAQRIMGLGNRGKAVLIATHLTEVLVFTLIAFITLAGISMGQDILNEVKFLSVIDIDDSKPRLFLILIGLMSMFFVAIEGQTNWAGSLVNSSLQKISSLNLSRYAYIFLISVLVIPVSLYFGKVRNILEFILGISAGVAPIFVLRWFTPRINAQTQLTAMVSAIVFNILFDVLWHLDGFQLTSLSKPFPVKIVFVTISVLSISYVVSYFTYTKEDLISYNSFKSKLEYPKSLRFKVLKSILYGIVLCLVYIALIQILLYV